MNEHLWFVTVMVLIGAGTWLHQFIQYRREVKRWENTEKGTGRPLKAKRGADRIS